MVAATSTHFDQRSYPAVDAADKESCRPDFAIALYPGHLWNDDGNFKLNPSVPVTTNTPPTFLVQAENDPVDNVNNSLVYYLALKNAGFPWRCICMRRADMPMGCGARSFRLRNGPGWWRRGWGRSE